jgi:hypothetical protein
MNPTQHREKPFSKLTRKKALAAVRKCLRAIAALKFRSDR